MNNTCTLLCNHEIIKMSAQCDINFPVILL